MANELSIATRRAVITYLRAWGALTALVPSASIYGEQPATEPSWPFVRYDLGASVPDRATGLDGCKLSVSISAFAQGPGADAAAAIGSIIATLEEAEINTEAGDRLNIFWTGSQLLRDTEEADAWHSLSTFDIEVAAD